MLRTLLLKHRLLCFLRLTLLLLRIAVGEVMAEARVLQLATRFLGNALVRFGFVLHQLLSKGSTATRASIS